MVIKDLINKLDKLLQQQQDKSRFDKYKNPLLSLITPRWYFADSFKLFHNVPLKWEIYEKNDYISKLANEINEIDTSIPEGSTFEVSFCSWYQPYHFAPRDKWGVHIRYRCWGTLSLELYRECPNLINNCIDSVKAAFFYLYIHEFFHYLIENVTSIIEIECKDPFLYVNYLSNIYTKIFNTRECLEEVLANSYLFERNDSCHIEKEYLEQKLLNQHPGYNSFINYSGANFKDGLRQLISQIAKNSECSSTAKIINIAEKTEFTNIHYLENVPIWINQEPLRTY